jgi:hypothetical protein
MILIHQQGIICGVAFDRSALRRIAPYASVVAPRCSRLQRDFAQLNLQNEYLAGDQEASNTADFSKEP